MQRLHCARAVPVMQIIHVIYQIGHLTVSGSKIQVVERASILEIGRGSGKVQEASRIDCKTEIIFRSKIYARQAYI